MCSRYSEVDSDDPELGIETPQFKKNPNWMSQLPRIYEASVGDIIWPGTHDSGAHCEKFDYTRVVSEDRLRSWGTRIINNLGSRTKKFADRWTRTQKLSVGEQLEHGVRYLDLRVSKCLDDGLYYIVHSFCGPNIEILLEEIVAFMFQNTKECILIELSPCSFVEHVELYRLFEKHIGNLMLKRNGYKGTSPFSLKLSHLLENGRIIVLYKSCEFYSHMGTLSSFWNGNGHLYAPFVMSMEPEEKESFQLLRYSHFRHQSDGSQIFHFMYALTPRLREIVWSIFSRRDDHSNPGSLEGCALKINPRLERFIEKIKNHSSMDKGVIVSIDYVEQSELVQLVIEMNQGQLG